MKKNKIVKTAGICLLVVAFLAAAAFCVYSLRNDTEGKKGETEKKNVSVKKSEKEIYEIGEDVEKGDMVFRVLEAGIMNSYEDLDAYYKQRKYLVSQEEYARKMEGSVFPEEVRFMHLKVSMTNNGEKSKGFSPADLNVTSILSKDILPEMPWREFSAYDGQYLTEDGKESDNKFSGQRLGSVSSVTEDISIAPDETVIVDFVGEFQECQNIEDTLYDYNLYLQVNDTGRKVTTDSAGVKIRLNLERTYDGELKKTEPILYSDVRRIAEMKSQNFTNSEMTKGQQGYFRGENSKETVLQQGAAGEQYILNRSTQGMNDEVTDMYMYASQPLDFQLTDWADMPEDFAAQGNLEKMAQRYETVYGYKKEDLKLLFLDIAYLADGFGKKYKDGSIVNFYECSYLFCLSSDETWRIFGTADDWTVLSNSRNPENIGILNMERLTAGDSVKVRMAYIVPPDFLQEHDALYFGGGTSSTVDPENSWAKIELK